MKLKHLLGQALLAASLIAASTEIAQASVTSTVAAGIRGTQFGRLSRNAIPQSWAHTEPYPGYNLATLNTQYFYTTYTVSVGSLNYLDFIFDSTSLNTFFSVYQGNYDPTNLATNWLGDAGTSGNYFGTDPIFVDVVAAMNSTVTLVVYNTAANGVGINDPFTITTSAYPDSTFNSDPVELQPVRVPEPSTVLLLLAPLALFGARRAIKRGGAANDGMALAA